MSTSDLAGRLHRFHREILLPVRLAFGSEPQGGKDAPCTELGRCGHGDQWKHSRSETLFLTLETNTLGFKALTFMVKSHLLSSSHAVHAAFSVGGSL